jgi:hypothetical protein
MLRRFTRDRGACGHDTFAMGGKEGPAAIVANSIWLTHFCYSNARVYSDWLHGPWRACFGALQSNIVSMHSLHCHLESDYAV